jgi:SPOR domain
MLAIGGREARHARGPASDEDEMSVFGSRSAEINLDEFERRLRAAGTPSANLDDPLSELARLVEASWPGAASASAVPVSNVPSPRLEAGALRPALEATHDDQGEPLGAPEPSHDPGYHEIGHVDDRMQGSIPRRRNWTLSVAALAVVGVGMIGAVFALKGGVPGLPKQPPFIAAAQGPTKVQPPSEDAVAASNDDGANLLKDSTRASSVKVVATEEQPVDLNAQSSLGAARLPVNVASTPADSGAASGTLVTSAPDAPVVAPAAPPSPVIQQFPDPKPVRTISLRPDGTPIPTLAAALADTADSAPPTEPPKLPAKPAAKPALEATGNAQPSTPKLELPTKLSPKSSARVVVGKADPTTGAADTANATTPPAAPTKSEKAKAAKTQQAALSEGTAATQQTVDSTAATKSTSWAVQLAAPKSEAEATSEVARLNAKYASDLNGSLIGVHKALVNGDTIYRLRVVGLSKADAAALCARLKGDGGECFIAK